MRKAIVCALWAAMLIMTLVDVRGVVTASARLEQPGSLASLCRELKAADSTFDQLDSHSLLSSSAVSSINLDSLIALVNTDSLEAHVRRLESFSNRLPGDPVMDTVRGWLMDLFSSYGYDSVYIDTFGTSGQYHNIIVQRTGSDTPAHQVMVAAHYDAYYQSPGADCNASGCAGVLEIARLFADLPSRNSARFVLFDGGERDRIGSRFMAQEAVARGDSIAVVLDMDMIGSQGTGNKAYILSGDDLTNTYLWKSLASSLVGVTGTFYQTYWGDESAFGAAGYPAFIVGSDPASEFWETPADSAGNMDFAFMTKMVKASAATAYTIVDTYKPTPVIEFQPVTEVGPLVTPGEPLDLVVDIKEYWNPEVTPGSYQLHYEIEGSAPVSVPLQEISPGRYTATIPALECYASASFRYSGEEAALGTVYSDTWNMVAATSRTIKFEDDFETHKFWTVNGTAFLDGYTMGGRWERKIPCTGGYDWGGAPTADYDGSGYCYLTLNWCNSDWPFVPGDSTTGAGTTELISPLIDLSAGQNRIEFATWFSNYRNVPRSTTLKIYVTGFNNAYWQLVDSIGPAGDEAHGGWNVHTFDPADFVEPRQYSRVKLVVWSWSCGMSTEAALDAFKVYEYHCDIGEPDTDFDGIPDISDNCPTVSNPGQEDVNHDGIGDACCCVGIAGNVDGDADDLCDIGDLSRLINYLFAGQGTILDCPNEANIDGVPGIDIGDMTWLISYLFISYIPPESCP